MKNLTRLAAAALGLFLGSAALTADDKKGDAKPVTDAEFVIKAASGGMFEVESSKAAKDGGVTGDALKFAEKMIADHEKANKELKEAATKAGQGLPTKMLDEHQKMLDKVKAAKGRDLERVYLETQVTAHEEAVALFESASKSATDAGLKAFAAKTLPTIKEHHEHAKKHAKGDR
jgi:putative membrane protein